MRRKPVLLLYLLFFVALEGSGLQAGVLQGTASSGQSARPGTWTARSRTGLTLTGTWTVVADPKTGP
ncbi:MAG: hypothetical protein H0W08_05405 [Acidobacteria bacterium]|nr:hypothetical protein [Acidobacteriota bacterium]